MMTDTTTITKTQPFSDFERRVADALNQTSGITEPEQWLIDALGGGTTSRSGVRVTVDVALGLPSVWNAVQRIAGHIGLLPLELHRRTGSASSVIVRDHPGARVLRVPGDLQTGSYFRETLMVHALLNGNGRAWIRRGAGGQPVELLILWPNATYTVMIDGVKWHAVYLHPWYYDEPVPYGDPSNFADNRGTLYRIPDDDVLHIPGLGYSGLWGYDLISVAKDVFGLDASGLGAASYSFANNGRPGLLLEAPRGVFRTEKDAKEFMDDFNAAHEGIDKAGRTGLLREGMKAHVLPLSAQDAQHIENRSFSREDIALLFGTEAVLDGSSVYKGLTEKQTAYVTNCLAKWFTKWQDECNRKLLSQIQFDADSHFFQFNPLALLKGDLNSLADYTGKLRQQGAISGNEVRVLHNMNPEDDAALESYGNPNISVGVDSDNLAAREEDEREPEVDTVSATRARAAVARNFDTLIAHEAEQLVRRAKKPGNYVAYLDGFYDRFEAKLTAVCEDLLMPTEAAVAHCRESKAAVLEVTGTVSQEGLPEAVAELVNDWRNTRIERFTCNV